MGAVSAYIPLLTLLQLLDTLRFRHKYDLNRVDPQQIDDLEKLVLYYLEFLESHQPGPDDPEIEPLILEIRDSVVAACKVIDFHVVYQTRWETWFSAFREDMVLIIRDLESIKDKVTPRYFSEFPVSQRPLNADSSNSSMKSYQTKVVGFENHISCIKDKLITSHVKSREVLPIVGMGGIGKTTLALSIYQDHPAP